MSVSGSRSAIARPSRALNPALSSVEGRLRGTVAAARFDKLSAEDGLPVDFPRLLPNVVGKGEPPCSTSVTPKGRILTAALECAAKKSWADVTLLDIAEGAKLPLSELRGLFASKTDIIAALLRAVDDEVLQKAPARAEGQEKRDRLFDIVMTRFDVLAPYKAALKSIYASGAADFALAVPYLSSQHWMLQAAGIGTDGAVGALRVTGLAVAYASVFRVWLDDDDPGHARTMAALDRRLRRGERALAGLEQIGSTATRVAEALREGLRAARRSREQPAPKMEPGARHRHGLTLFGCKSTPVRQSLREFPSP